MRDNFSSLDGSGRGLKGKRTFSLIHHGAGIRDQHKLLNEDYLATGGHLYYLEEGASFFQMAFEISK